ncbi:Phosphopantetheine adenylyltransferase [Arcticibacter svalbardensis MN12-7]|uniref:Phosphopantetheine adenylyltransferase n=1 Tax=Arcticibacter svalbardensis MN12-7 TaxID=1150600 RepID=R9GZA5_9SPHI|nr:pantetheine-phosphate adenylyltransferase [Arcticibacter svalbardensis]EOR94304.1 Phosphopantetheine adenylyltransferase [Arcticibacter svalbardensis MN12-7]
MKIALFPGSFDPLTVAHVDIIKRSVSLFDKVVIALGINSTKNAMLSSETRINILEAVFASEPKVEITSYEGLTVNFCKQIGAQYMIRGIRTVSDFEYEKAIAQMNHELEPGIESIFILSNPGYSYMSSTIVRDILRHNGDISKFVPKEALAFL